MEVSVQHHAPTDLPPVETPQVPTEFVTEWAPEPWINILQVHARKKVSILIPRHSGTVSNRL
jgi:hypothetical protein